MCTVLKKAIVIVMTVKTSICKEEFFTREIQALPCVLLWVEMPGFIFGAFFVCELQATVARPGLL